MLSLPIWFIVFMAWCVGYCSAAFVTHRRDTSPITGAEILLVIGVYLCLFFLFVPHSR